VSAEHAVRIALTDEQVRGLIRRFSKQSGLAELLSQMSDLDRLRALAAPYIGNPAYSPATFRAAFVLAALPQDGGERTIAEVSRETGLVPSVTHRYLRPWVALEIASQDPGSRRYSRAEALTGQQDRNTRRYS
jgi:hypothetical protein